MLSISVFWAQWGQGLGPWDPGVHLIRSASLGICVLIRIHLRSHSLDLLRSQSLDFFFFSTGEQCKVGGVVGQVAETPLGVSFHCLVWTAREHASLEEGECET